MKPDYDLDTTAPSFAATQRDYDQRSDAAAGMPGARLDLAYGAHPRQRLDAFPAGPDAPVLVFWRGGYWRAGSKEARRFPALEWCPRGVGWIAVNHRLLPDFTLADAITDARAALSWIARQGRQIGVDPDNLHLVGNSAGGHLAAMAAAADWPERPAIRSLTAISGLFDLTHLLDATPNEWLRLDAASAFDLSPVNHLPEPGLRVAVCCGGDETPAFRFQSDLFSDACRANGNRVEDVRSPGKHHFQIIGELGTPGTPVFDSLARIVAAG